MQTSISKDPNEIKIISQKAPCAWVAIADRLARDQNNRIYWTSGQVESMNRLLTSFMEVYGEDNVVMNINQNFFTFKVFKPSRCQSDSLVALKAMMVQSGSKPYEWGFNNRNQLL